MTTYRSPPTRQLKEGDVVIFPIPRRLHGCVGASLKDGSIRYLLREDHLNNEEYNRSVFQCFTDARDSSVYDFASKAYGYKTETGCWPCFKRGDYAAATRLVRAIYSKLGYKLSKREKAEQAKAEVAALAAEKKAAAAEARSLAAIEHLPIPIKAVVGVLRGDRGAFGCQRENVLKLMCAIYGGDVNAALTAMKT